MKKPIKKSTGKSISVPRGMKIEIEKEEGAAYKKKEKAEKAKKMKMMEKFVAAGVKAGMKSAMKSKKK